ncbi:MAG: hypothetical protein FMNOHCHN_03804 [Ignavibacteriaceae bacterium]|nr:hypothetical protein [Ignavibacteriaceae bacterium]
MELFGDKTLDEYADKFYFEGGEPKELVSAIPKPNSFWVAWYECRPTVIQFDNTGEWFYALGQDALWHKQHAELIEEIKVFAIAGINLTTNKL